MLWIMKQPTDKQDNTHGSYWHSSLKILWVILFVWFFVSFGCGILFKDALDQINVGGAPLGFWMAQQGSILGFVSLLVVYSYLMNKLDEKHGYGEEK